MKNRIAEYLPTAWFRRGSAAGAGQAGGSGLKALTEPIEQFVTKHPGASLAVAFAAGVAIAWWLKRK